MGTRYTAPMDQAAGPDAHRRGLTPAQADDALYQRLSAILDIVSPLREAMGERHGPWSRVHSDLWQIEEELIQLIEDADYVHIISRSMPERRRLRRRYGRRE